MNTTNIEFLLQYAAWLIAMIELVLGLYILVLNPRQPSNRYSSIVLLVIAANSFAVGTLIGASLARQALLSAAILAATTPAIQPVLLVATVAILRPNWLRGAGSLLWQMTGLAAIIPAIATILDLLIGTRIWFTGIPETYAGGFIHLDEFTGGTLSSLIRTFGFSISAVLVLVLLFYFAFFDRSLTRGSRNLARLLFIADGFAAVSIVVLTSRLLPAVSVIFPSVVFALAYAYAGFQQMISERRLQRGSLQVRLTALVLVVTIPLVVVISVFVVNRAGSLLEQSDLETLRTSNRLQSVTVDRWLQANLDTLKMVADQPDIISMDPERQTTVLKSVANTYDYMYLVSTTDINGFNTARSDGGEMTNYSDRAWYQQVRDGAPFAMQTLIGRTSGQPAIVMSVPVHSSGELIGVAMFAADLDQMIGLVQAGDNPQAISIVVNDQNQLVAHADPTYTAQLLDMSGYPPVENLRTGESGTNGETTLVFSDDDGVAWRTHAIRLENGWIIATQIPESQLLANVIIFRQVALVIVAIGTLFLLGMSWFTIRQAIQPIHALTKTAAGITGGDLTLVAPVETDDELGLLARAFNSMTAQLRELITNLERRVVDRTRDLERRALQLQVAAEVAREAATIRELEELLDHIVNLISEKFNFYHAGIFLLDDAEKYAILRAASSEGGHRMLARGHRLEVGQVGIVGYVAGKAEPRIALDVGKDAVFFNNPDLPQTRSEMALPLKARGRVIGVLDVQSTRGGAFVDEDVAVLQILADQVALAIENSRLIHESQQSLRELETLYQQQVSRAWKQRLAEHEITYIYDPLGVRPAVPGTQLSTGQTGNGHTLQVPIQLRGQALGTLILRRDAMQPAFRAEEIELVKTAVSQVALTLDNARLLEENRRRALTEQTIGQITSRAQTSLDLDTVIKTAVQEIGLALGSARVQIRLTTEEQQPGGEAAAFHNNASSQDTRS